MRWRIWGWPLAGWLAFAIGLAVAWRVLGVGATEQPAIDLRAWVSRWGVADESVGSDPATGLPLRVVRSIDATPMRLVPAGVFVMGRAQGEDARERIASGLGKRWHPRSEDKPAHSVRLSKAFYIDETEATMKRRSAKSGAVVLPAAGVLWREAKQYAEWVGGDLPTEAEWEYAARGGKSGQVYPWGDTDDPRCRNGAGDADGYERLAPVASYPPNGYGLFDMVGNVDEWCADSRLRPYATHVEPVVDPLGVDSDDFHVLRGGGFSSGAITLRTSERSMFEEERLEFIGFRVVIRVPPNAR